MPPPILRVHISDYTIFSPPSYAHNFGFSFGCHVFPNARNKLIDITVTPKVAQIILGNFVLLLHFAFGSTSFKWQAAGKMNASAVADTPPVISSITPRSQVMRETVREAMMMADVKKRWRSIEKGSCEKKYCSMTSRQTKSSKGRVVNMFIPKQNRATLIRVSLGEKLFRIFP